MSEMTKRVQLYQQLPLQTPFSVHMFVSYFCNFSCKYCLHALSKEQLASKNFHKQFMDFELYRKAIEDLTHFDNKIKALIFAGHGEPLLHKDIAAMVAYAKEKDVAERVEIVTNGSLLTKALADDLIAAGLDRLRISVQGIDAKAYQDTMGKPFDFSRFLAQLAYFYQHKTKTEVYCKIIDVAMKSKEEEKIFMEIFSPVADETAIEYEIPFVKEVDNRAFKQEFSCSKQGNYTSGAKVCSMPFYMLVVTPTGDVVPCCSTDIPLVYGNIKEKNLKEIWESPIVKGFCRVHLLGNRELHPICSVCSVPQYGLQAGDYLDEYAAQLLEKYPMERGIMKNNEI